MNKINQHTKIKIYYKIKNKWFINFEMKKRITERVPELQNYILENLEIKDRN